MTDLHYASPQPEHHLRRAALFQRVARWCGWTPMSLGIAITLFYWIFDFNFLISAGLLLLPLGALAVLTGLIFALLAYLQFCAFARLTHTPVSSGSLRLVALLLSNFLVAILCYVAGAALATGPQFNVSIINDTGMPLDRCQISSFWSPRPVAVSVPPGAIITEQFKVRRARLLTLRLEQGGAVKQITIPGVPGTLKIHIGPNLTFDNSGN
jgi:hypothetical protein